MARIFIRNLICHGVIGVHPWEKERKQKIVFNIEIEFDATKAVKSDNIKDTIDYEKVSQDVILITANSSYELVESLAQDVLNSILSDKHIKYAEVTLDKPEALETAESVAVSLEKFQHEQSRRKPGLKSKSK